MSNYCGDGTVQEDLKHYADVYGQSATYNEKILEGLGFYMILLGFIDDQSALKKEVHLCSDGRTSDFYDMKVYEQAVLLHHWERGMAYSFADHTGTEID